MSAPTGLAWEWRSINLMREGFNALQENHVTVQVETHSQNEAITRYQKWGYTCFIDACRYTLRKEDSKIESVRFFIFISLTRAYKAMEVQRKTTEAASLLRQRAESSWTRMKLHVGFKTWLSHSEMSSLDEGSIRYCQDRTIRQG